MNITKTITDMIAQAKENDKVVDLITCGPAAYEAWTSELNGVSPAAIQGIKVAVRDNQGHMIYLLSPKMAVKEDSHD